MRSRDIERIWLLCLLVVSIGTMAHAFEFENSSENLKKLFETIMQKNKKGDYERAAVLTKSLMPDRRRVALAFRRNVSEEIMSKLDRYYVKVLPSGLLSDRGWAKMLCKKPERSVVLVHSATTEEMIRQERGSIVWKEFPGGAVRMAKSILKPGMRFYEVERLEPGKDHGYKYHLIFWDGRRWCMLGAIWRAFPVDF